MAYQDSETGLTSGQPIELYKFEGTFQSYYLTSYSEPIISGGQEYTPLTISRNKFKVGTQEQPENAMEISMPFDHPMVSTYAYQNAPPVLLFTLLRAHETDPNDVIIMWHGRVTGFSVSGRTAKMRVPTLFSYILQGNAPVPRFQAPCNHVLYDALCTIDPALHQNVTTVTGVSGNVVSVASNTFGAGEVAAGMMFSAAGENRMMVSEVGLDISLTYAFASLEIGDTVTMRKGCNHSFEGHCKTRFLNGARFGGFPIVPTKNPFGSALI